MNNPTILTENLRLRPFTPTDATSMHQIMSGKDVLRYFPGAQAPSLEQVQRMISLFLTHWQEKGYGLWAVEHRSMGALLGRCGLQYLAETDEVEVDFILDRHYWGRGFATEAGMASLQYGFNELGLTTIVGIVHPENIASQRVLQKLGMQFAEKTEYFGMACYRYVGQRPFS
ncbi:MAG: GNAT family N-acetyltransferase [Chloroflexi bacterium]|nr:GNAT family N-acetyltransferase [Chloroflexota bacterium]